MASQSLTLGLVCRTLDVEPEALPTVKTLRLERLRLAALCPLDALAGSLRELYLRDNRLETLDCAEALAALAPHLAVLDLARNRLAEVRGLAALRGLRVLDLSANELARDPGADGLPLASLTVLDLRGNPFGRTRVTAGPVLEELDGEAVVPRAGGGRSTVTAAGDAARRPVARSECVVYVPLVGNRPGEAAKRTLALRFGRADDVARVARDFCAAHAVDGADAVRELTEICRAAAAAPPRLVGPDRGDAGAALGLEAQIEETGDALARCARGVDGALAGARATAAAAVEKRRAAARARAAAAAAAPTAAARADESARRRAAAAAAEAAARRAFAASVRARLPAAYESSPKAKRAPPSRLPEAPRDDEEFDRYTAAPAELDARPPDAYDAADDSSDDSYAAA